MNIITSAKNLNRAVTEAIKASHKIHEQLHVLGVSLIHHCMTEGNGDLSIAARLVDGLHKGTRKNQLQVWFEENTGYKFLKADGENDAKFRKPRNWEGFPVKLEDLETIDPYWVREEKPAKAFDLEQWAKRGSQKLVSEGVTLDDAIAAIVKEYNETLNKHLEKELKKAA